MISKAQHSSAICGSKATVNSTINHQDTFPRVTTSLIKSLPTYYIESLSNETITTRSCESFTSTPKGFTPASQEELQVEHRVSTLAACNLNQQQELQEIKNHTDTLLFSLPTLQQLNNKALSDINEATSRLTKLSHANSMLIKTVVELKVFIETFKQKQFAVEINSLLNTNQILRFANYEKENTIESEKNFLRELIKSCEPHLTNTSVEVTNTSVEVLSPLCRQKHAKNAIVEDPLNELARVCIEEHNEITFLKNRNQDLQCQVEALHREHQTHLNHLYTISSQIQHLENFNENLTRELKDLEKSQERNENLKKLVALKIENMWLLLSISAKEPILKAILNRIDEQRTFYYNVFSKRTNKS